MARKISAGKEWRVLPPPPVGAVEQVDLPPIVARLLYRRGISTRPGVDSYLNPVLHDPALLPDMEAASHRLSKALKAGETIGIFGDFDVDGVTGTALVAQALGDLGAKLVAHIPHRVSEGHGLNASSVRALREQGVSVLVTVDCGVTSQEEVLLARELGMDVIITDHHEPPPTLPPALCIVDPKLGASDYPFLGLSGGGLAFKLVQGLYELLGRPWKRDLLELAALSTVADMVPLKDENRYLVKEGLKELRRTHRPGLLALYRRAGIRAESIDVQTISFMIAPRLNAAGRLGHAYAAYRLLLTQSFEEAEALAEQLEILNRERRQLSEEAYSSAREMVLDWGSVPRILLVEDHRFTPGIAGLIAGRLVEEFYRPAVAMSVVNGVVRASARSIPEFDVAAALSQCDDLFVRHGGHSQAAGFQMLPENLGPLKERLSQIAEDNLGRRDLKPGLTIDAEVPIAGLTGETFRWLKELEPFGMENPTPAFLTRNLYPIEARPMGAQGRHLRLKLKEGNLVWDAFAFRQGDRWVPDTRLLDVVYSIGTERRGGSEVLALKVLDFRPSAG